MTRLILIAGLLLAAFPLAAAAGAAELEPPLAFSLDRPPAPTLDLFAFEDQGSAPARDDFLSSERHGGAETRDWPYKGFAITPYMSVYPLPIAYALGVDFAIPLAPYVSAVVRVEGHVGLLFSGWFFAHGARVNYDFSEKFGVYGEFGIRFGIGEFTVARLLEDFLPEELDAGIGTVSGFGWELQGGIETGGESVKFFVGLVTGSMSFNSTLNIFDVSIDLPSISIPYGGINLGIRIYVG